MQRPTGRPDRSVPMSSIVERPYKPIDSLMTDTKIGGVQPLRLTEPSKGIFERTDVQIGIMVIIGAVLLTLLNVF
jgi:hypothetical protein